MWAEARKAFNAFFQSLCMVYYKNNDGTIISKGISGNPYGGFGLHGESYQTELRALPYREVVQAFPGITKRDLHEHPADKEITEDSLLDVMMKREKTLI